MKEFEAKKRTVESYLWWLKFIIAKSKLEKEMKHRYDFYLVAFLICF